MAYNFKYLFKAWFIVIRFRIHKRLDRQ